MLGYTELNVGITKNHLALMSYFANPSLENAVLLEIPLRSRKSINVSIVTSACSTMLKPVIFIHRESGTYGMVTVMLIRVIST